LQLFWLFAAIVLPARHTVKQKALNLLIDDFVSSTNAFPALRFINIRREGSVMHSQISDDNYESDVIPFERPAKGAAPSGSDQLDNAGQTILQLVQRAAGIADENSRHALGMAQKLSDQLRAAEDRVAELEAQATAYQNRAERAEQWLHRVYTEIEDRFLQQNDSGRAMSGAPQRAQSARRSR
jgi:hypothetical protein